MSGFTINSSFVDTKEGWESALAQLLSVPSYKKFFEVTSKHTPVVVKNNPSFAHSSDRGNCHLNCKLAEEQGFGKRVSGWYVMCEHLYEEMPVGNCRLIHHSNILLPDGTLINPTDDEGKGFHVFIQDESRQYDFEADVGYNDRMIFGDEFLKDHPNSRSIPRNKVYFASADQYDRNMIYERFKRYTSKSELFNALPKTVSREEQMKWMALKTTGQFEP